MNYKPVLFLALLLLSFRDENPGQRNIDKIHDAFDSYVETTHPQKIYLHLDKEKYFARERIWFKAYVLDETTLLPDSHDDHLLVELIDPYERRVQVVRIATDPLKSTGSFYLHDTIPEGIYQVRAYTPWMQNHGPTFFFSRNIEVQNPGRKYLITPKTARSNERAIRKHKQPAKTHTIGFFPEGGDLLENIESIVAFKAEDGLGKGVEIKGKVVDKKKNVIATFQTAHSGMGAFRLKPEKDNVYTAHIRFPDGSHRKIILPRAKNNSVGLKLIQADNQIHVVLRSNKLPSSDRPANEFILIGQVRHTIYYASGINLLDADSIIRIAPNVFPTGIVHFTLFNNRLQPVAERIHFVNHNDFYHFKTSTSHKNDSLRLDVSPLQNFSDNEYFSGSVAIVAGNGGMHSDPDNNILTHLYLTSELPGRIEHPAYYLKNNDPAAVIHTELLMLTHGWKRFIWEDLLENSSPEMKYEKGEGISIEGKITREIFEFPIPEARVQLFILNEYNDEYSTQTDQRGTFRFSNMYYTDTVDVKIVARKQGGGKNLLIHLERHPFREVSNRYGDFFLTTTSEMNMKAYRKRQAEISKEEMRKREKELDSIFRDNIYGTPDFVLWGDEIPSGCTNLLDAMQGRIPGVNITGNTVTIRGINSIMCSNEPLLLVDGIPAGMETIRSIPVSDVERIEILKGPSTAMYGSRGANGVIAVHTKRGMFLKKGEIRFSVIGYHVAQKFHSPAAENANSRVEKGYLPLTIYWNPEIIMHSGVPVEIALPGNYSGRDLYFVFEGISNQGKAGYTFAPLPD